MKVTIPNATFIRLPNLPRKIGFEYSQYFITAVDALISEAEKKHISQLCIEMKLPFRPRTTGKNSQNSRFWGHCADIAQQLGGYTPQEIHDAILRMSVSEGYPTRLSIDGKEIPSPTRSVSVEELSIVLDVMQRFADENNLYLTEYDKDDIAYQSIGGRTKNEMDEYRVDETK